MPSPGPRPSHWACCARGRWAAAPPSALLFNFGFYGMVFTAGLEFQHQRGYSALGTGLALFPAVAMTRFASVLSGRLSRRTGDRPLVISGMLLAALGLAGWAAAGADPAYALLGAPMMAAGFGTSFALTGSTATVMGAAPPAYSGAASALFNTTRQVGSATGVALGGSLLASAANYGTGIRTSMGIGASPVWVRRSSRGGAYPGQQSETRTDE